MDQQSQQYSLQILGRDENGVQEEIGTITASEIGMYWVDTLNAAQELLNRQNESCGLRCCGVRRIMM